MDSVILARSPRWREKSRPAPLQRLHSAIRTPQSALDVIAPIQLREKIIAALAVREKRFVHVAGIELFPEAIEAEQVIGHALGGVMFRGPGFHQEGPVARLREQQLPCELFQNAIG